eukprot:TRINITY_DN35899_c0_g1_i1.p1 TRINITY_DN35899_c0_g1~~TRINITY_DN35899_c0_g1_i1.p1  ORF type:complete len:131 (+),score=37.04 TRINITY_DN35899_c0_g1_i1:67-459(+)
MPRSDYLDFDAKGCNLGDSREMFKKLAAGGGDPGGGSSSKPNSNSSSKDKAGKDPSKKKDKKKKKKRSSSSSSASSEESRVKRIRERKRKAGTAAVEMISGGPAAWTGPPNPTKLPTGPRSAGPVSIDSD